jgi:hypothetical protein
MDREKLLEFAEFISNSIDVVRDKSVVGIREGSNPYVMNIPTFGFGSRSPVSEFLPSLRLGVDFSTIIQRFFLIRKLHISTHDNSFSLSFLNVSLARGFSVEKYRKNIDVYDESSSITDRLSDQISSSIFSTIIEQVGERLGSSGSFTYDLRDSLEFLRENVRAYLNKSKSRHMLETIKDEYQEQMVGRLLVELYPVPLYSLYFYRFQSNRLSFHVPLA